MTIEPKELVAQVWKLVQHRDQHRAYAATLDHPDKVAFEQMAADQRLLDKLAELGGLLASGELRVSTSAKGEP